MAIKLNNSQLDQSTDASTGGYRGKQSPSTKYSDSYLGKQKRTGSGHIGLSGKKGGYVGELKGNGFSAGEQKGRSGYSPNDAT